MGMTTSETTIAEHWDVETFRAHAHRAVDAVAEWMATVEERPIVPAVAPGDIRAMLPDHAPASPDDFEDVLADLDRIVVPGLLQWQHPGFFAYFPANTSPPSVIAEFVAAALGQQGMLWSTSPVTTELESHVLDWLVDAMGLPTTWRVDSGVGGGVIQMSASDATHAVHVVARSLAVAGGAATDDVVAYASSQAHSSVEKACIVAGIRHVRLIEVDDRFAMSAAALTEAVQRDLADGLRPAIVTSAIGTTGTGAVDDVPAVVEVARRHGMWHHVDAAWAGTAWLCEEHRDLTAGFDDVDSCTWNPHKWMLTNFDCNVLWVADRRQLVDTLSITPPYLRNVATDTGEVVDYRDWHVPLGRRLRALKLWWVIRSYGLDGLRRHVRHHVRLAAELAAWLDVDDRFALVAPTSLSLVNVAHVDGDEATDALADAVNASGDTYLTPSSLPDGRRFLRVAIGQTRTEQRHVDRLRDLLDTHA